jgi:hypothetical protein
VWLLVNPSSENLFLKVYSMLDTAGGVLALALLWLNRRKPTGLDRHGSR